jgi:hypothetical protein
VAKYDPEKDDLAQVVGYHLATNVVQTDHALILRPYWASMYMSKQNRLNYDSRIEATMLASALPRLLAEVAEDQVRFSPKGVPHPLYRVAPTGTVKRLRWHWFFEGAWISLDGPALKTNDYLEALAKTLGGTLKEVEDSLRIDLDGDEFKRRGISTYQSLAKGVQPHALLPVASAQYSGAVFERLTAAQLYEAYRDSGKTSTFPDLAADPHVQNLALIRLREDRKVSIGSPEPGESGIPIHIYEKFDFWGPWTPYIFAQTGGVSSLLRSRDGKENIVL